MDIKRKLNYHYKYFDFSQISPDPLQFPHKFSAYHDIEISAFLSSIFAFGNVKQIISTLDKIHAIMGESPYEFVMKFDKKRDAKLLKGIIHRFYSTEDIVKLFAGLKRIYDSYGTLSYLFLLYHFDNEEFLKTSISKFSQNLLSIILEKEEASHGVKFMFPDPYFGSACKRMNLFLRWMVRKDELDFGLWNEINPSKLVIPVDTHVLRICKELKLTK